LKFFGRQQLNLEKGACNIFWKALIELYYLTTKGGQNFSHQQLKIIVINDEKIFRLLYCW